jgi:hypothetical protein
VAPSVPGNSRAVSQSRSGTQSLPSIAVAAVNARRRRGEIAGRLVGLNFAFSGDGKGSLRTRGGNTENQEPERQLLRPPSQPTGVCCGAGPRPVARLDRHSCKISKSTPTAQISAACPRPCRASERDDERRRVCRIGDCATAANPKSSTFTTPRDRDHEIRRFEVAFHSAVVSVFVLTSGR